MPSLEQLLTPFDEEETEDVLELVQEMRAHGGDLDLVLPAALVPWVQRDIAHTLETLRRFGYVCYVTRDRAHRITQVRLLEQ